MIFASDNWAGVHPEIARHVVEKTSGFTPSYANSDIDKDVVRKIGELFECEVSVFLVGTGTIANSLALSAVARPGGVVFCHENAHIIVDECGGPEFFTDGVRLHGVSGNDGKVDPGALENAVARYPREFVHHGQPAAISITQLTEAGTTYSLSEVSQISDIARSNDIPLHMDGARFANAIARLAVSPAEMTWKSGVDVLSFGGTKNGCWCAEAIVFFNEDLARDFEFIHKRAGQLYSKSSFLSAQFEALLEDGLWLKLARHANEMAALLTSHIKRSSKLRLAWQPDANEVFAIMKSEVSDELLASDAMFFIETPPAFITDSMGEDEVLARFVCSFATRDIDVDKFGELIS
ncbi:MAG: low specificity L-threonine aldolase [Pseudomonadota bacterium]